VALKVGSTKGLDMRQILGLIGREASRHEIGEREVVEERHISEGGFGYVSQVRDVADGRVYALKKILCQDDESFLSAQREVEILDNLPTHKNIVGFFGHSVVRRESRGARSERQVLILLELCPGGHLLDLLDRHGGVLPEEEVLRAMTDVSEAVFCLHSHSPPIQHRDLKLENILRGEDGFWKVCDFGSWSDKHIDLTNATPKQLSSIGEELERHTTMMYRPPEMVDVYQRFPVSCAVDIWMLGCVLFVLMFNHHPFQDAAALAIRNGQFRIPTRSPALREGFLDLLVWLLSVDPRERPNARKICSMLWQWHDLVLDVPQEVMERKQELMSRSGHSISSTQGTVADLSPPPSASFGVAGVGVAGMPWVAFEEGGESAGDDEWADFQGFQNADVHGESCLAPTAGCTAHKMVSDEQVADDAGSGGAVAADAALSEASAFTDAGGLPDVTLNQKTRDDIPDEPSLSAPAESPGETTDDSEFTLEEMSTTAGR